jgi:DNA-binding FadR family transcriptional regulator
VREALIALEVEGWSKCGSAPASMCKRLEIRRSRKVAAGHLDDGGATAGRSNCCARYVSRARPAALAAKSAKKGQVQAIEDTLATMEHDSTGTSSRSMATDVPHAHRGGHRQRRAGRRGRDAVGRTAPGRCTSNSSTTTILRRCGNPRWPSIAPLAIAAKDAAGARSAMQRHLNQAYKRFSTGWDSVTGTK